MKTFDRSLYDKKIIMISDYADPSLYTELALEEENMLLERYEKEISAYGIDYEYREFNSLKELNSFLKCLPREEVIIFNWFEEVNGDANSAHLVTDMLEDMGFLFTGADTQCLKLTGSKKNTKEVLVNNEISTPKYFVAENIKDLSNNQVDLPIIVKMADMHASAGLKNENVVFEERNLLPVAKRMLEDYASPVLLAEYIEGEEYTIPVWGNGEDAQIISICKIDYKDLNINAIQTEVSKFEDQSEEYKNAPYKLLKEDELKKLENIIAEDILNAYKVLGFRDYGRFEVRVKNNKSYIIDANVNPALCFDSSIFGSTELMGYNYGETVLKICENALKRNM